MPPPPLTVRAAAELIARADSLDTLAPIALAIGCAGEPSPLDADTRRALGLDDAVAGASIARGVGALRVLSIHVRGDASLRDLLARMATGLSTRAPHVLWLILATCPERAEFAIAAWTDDRRPPRLVALVAHREQLVDSDADTLRALSIATDSRDLLVHARWVEVLGRDALSLRFYRALERTVGTIAASARGQGASDEARADIALLNTSRLLFLAFLEAKGWLDGDRAFLAHRFERCMTSGGGFHRRVLQPLFFGTLNTPLCRRAPAAVAFGQVPFLNGGLFARSMLERRLRGLVFDDDGYGALIYDLFGQYRFTAREESATWSEAAVDPEMLGRAFESLMHTRERRRTGAFFTPFPLVERIANAGLDALLEGEGGSAVRHPSLSSVDRASLRRRIERLTVLDPACGSGAFLVHALERLGDLLASVGDTRDAGLIRRDVLTRSIFGVDINPTAVWLCELRLWLSVVIESGASNPADVVPLPNLDRNIRAGDALAGGCFHAAEPRSGEMLRRLRERYSRASGQRKEALARELERVERLRALHLLDDELARIAVRRRDLVAASRGRDLFGERYRPSREERQTATLLRRRAIALRASRRRIANGGALAFSFPVHFAEVMVRGGFDLVVGNPPWVRLHRLSPQDRAAFRRTFEVARSAAWEPGAAPSGAGPGFAAQVDLAALFVERSLRLLASRGVLALLLPMKLWRSLAGGGVRRLVDRETSLCRIEDHSEAAASFDAAVYPSLIVARKAPVAKDRAPGGARLDIVIHRRGREPLAWQADGATLPFDTTPGAPWILLPPDARTAFELLRRNGPTLAESVVGRPYLGVKCGCNDAFVVELLDADDELAEVGTATGQRVIIERALLRPLVRGEHLGRWHVAAHRDHIIWTHDVRGQPLAALPPCTARWLARWRRTLAGRTDTRHRARWWSLFRTDGARTDRARVIWGDLGREPRASVLEAGDPTVALNSCYVARCPTLRDAQALAALLNGPLVQSWLNAITEPARGGYHRYFGWTLALMPFPTNWDRARDILAPLGERGQRGDTPGDMELFGAAVEAYGIARALVEPLLAWGQAPQ